MNLFQNSSKTYEPLASRMRPRTLEEYIGQDHILGPGRLLRRSIEADKLTSVLLSGPPGTGKTTLARVIAQTTKGAFLSVNAVLSGVKEIRELIEKAQEYRQIQGRKSILFVDEVHRWNKSQQDALLPWVENGTFILIGATTENPFFEVNKALVSRSRVFQLQPLGSLDLMSIARQALSDQDRGYGGCHIDWEPGALEHLVNMASGDARSLLNALELAVESSSTPFPPPEGTRLTILLSTAEESIQRKVVLYDKDGDYHFDTISAFIKSLRGSDPDAALYWMARMIRAGEDPEFLFRRMLILASEDVGLADPQALVVVSAASEAFRKVGLPEGQFHLSQAALYLATCAKSNSTLAYFEVLKSIETAEASEVPASLKDASRDGEAFRHGQGYQYPHAFRDHWVAQQYLPAGMQAQVFYRPTDQGYEGRIRDQVLARRELVLQTPDSDRHPENLSWGSPSLMPWLRRLDQDAPEGLQKLKEAVFGLARLARHHVVWIARDPRGFFLLESLRSVPEGQVLCSTPDATWQQAWQERLSFLPELQQPLWQAGGWFHEPSGVTVDVDFSWGELSPSKAAAGNRSIVVLPDHTSGARLSSLIPLGTVDKVTLDHLREVEERFLASLDGRAALQAEGYEIREVTVPGQRRIEPVLWKTWWTAGRPGSWPEFLLLDSPEWVTQMELIGVNSPKGTVHWPSSWLVGVKDRGGMA